MKMDPNFAWLPTKRTCTCEPNRLNCLRREETYKLGSTILNVRKRQRWVEEHPARFVSELPERYIKLFSHRGETVLDPFCGSGTTNIVAKKLQRNSIGIDVNPYSTKITEKRLSLCKNDYQSTKHQIVTGDMRKILRYIPENSIDLIVTSPPYFDVVDYKHAHPNQLGNIHNYSTFLNRMTEAFESMQTVLKPNGYIIVNTQDLYKKDAKCPIHSDYIQLGKKLGLEITNINIYVLNYSTGGRLVYGYPVAYYPKNDHEFNLIFKKI